MTGNDLSVKRVALDTSMPRMFVGIELDGRDCICAFESFTCHDLAERGAGDDTIHDAEIDALRIEVCCDDVVLPVSHDDTIRQFLLCEDRFGFSFGFPNEEHLISECFCTGFFV
mgnify:CR=1 FL=1